MVSAFSLFYKKITERDYFYLSIDIENRLLYNV